MSLVRDSKCDSPTACNAMETLLLHRNLIKCDLFNILIDMLKKEKVKINLGPKLHKELGLNEFPKAKSLSHEYSDLELTIEMVDNVESAIEHINNFSSHHTEAIITKNSN
jgi:delta-1-pyrroline-5-carboxylate synthetase